MEKESDQVSELPLRLFEDNVGHALLGAKKEPECPVCQDTYNPYFGCDGYCAVACYYTETIERINPNLEHKCLNRNCGKRTNNAICCSLTCHLVVEQVQRDGMLDKQRKLLERHKKEMERLTMHMPPESAKPNMAIVPHAQIPQYQVPGYCMQPSLQYGSNQPSGAPAIQYVQRYPSAQNQNFNRFSQC